MLVVADSSALIALAACDGLGLLLQVFDDLKIPEAVYAETVAPEKPYSEILGGFLADKVFKADIAHYILAAGGLGRVKLRRWRSTSNLMPMHY